MLMELAQKVNNAKKTMLEEAAKGIVAHLEYQILSAVADGKMKFAIADDFPEARLLLQTARFVKGPQMEEFAVGVEHVFSRENIKKVGDGACPAIQRLFADVRYCKSPISVSWVSNGPDVECGGNLILFWD